MTFNAHTKRNEAIIAAIQTAGDAGITVDTLRRKFQTTKANIVEALTELEGVYAELEYDVEDHHQTAYWIDGEDDQEDNGDADQDDQDDQDDQEDNGDADQDDQDVAMGDGENGEGDDSSEEDQPPTFRFPDRKKVEYEERGTGNCGDELAMALTNYLNVTHHVPRKDGKGNKKISGIDMVALRQVAEQNFVLVVRGNNPGQMRMNLSNTLRAKWRKGEDIRVGDTTLYGLNYKSPKQWQQEYAKSYITECSTKEHPITLKAALLIAEQAFAAKAEGGEYDPTVGDFRC